jgi:TRAP-type mannitol/chloroaromatic compound transport system permease small subunit
MSWLRRIDAVVAAVVSAGSWLVLPLVLLLFLQWPLRDVVGAYSREANDLGQWIFALYVVISITAATRQGTHLAADAVARRFPERRREQLVRIGTVLGVVPWALFVFVSSKNTVLASVTMLETFPDTYNPGYFIIKLAVWVLALLMLVQAVLTLLRPMERG